MDGGTYRALVPTIPGEIHLSLLFWPAVSRKPLSFTMLNRPTCRHGPSQRPARGSTNATMDLVRKRPLPTCLGYE